MIEIILSVCSILSASHCKNTHLTFEDIGQLAMPYACMMQSQIEGARWQESHPNWQIVGARCGVAGQTANL